MSTVRCADCDKLLDQDLDDYTIDEEGAHRCRWCQETLEEEARLEEHDRWLDDPRSGLAAELNRKPG